MLGNKSTDVIEEFSNYLIGIKNLSDQYVSNIITTLKQFLSFMNIYKYKEKYESYEDIELNDIRALSNSDIYSFIFYLALAIQAEQVYGKADNSNNNSTLVNQIRKNDNIIDIIPKDKKFNVV